MQVRNATPADLPAVVRMSACFYAGTSYSGWADFNAETVEALAASLGRDHVLLIAEHEGEAVGMVGLFVAPFMFNANVRAAYEVVWWVDESARSTGAGAALLRAIEPACKAKGAKAVQMVRLHNSPPAAAKLYERRGYGHSESSYTKVLT